MLNSIVCKYADFSEDWYKEQELNLMIRRIFAGHSCAQLDFVNRKMWEWCAISQVLDERCLLRTGIKGLGFAVGQEPLASHFAARGCTILATDLALGESDQGWVGTGQHAASKEMLFQPDLVNRAVFDRRVTFQPADMRTLEGLSPGYDFIWSSCALEHLGSLELGLEFIIRSAALLDRGGIAVHTTEYNVRSDDETIEQGPSVIYRRRDILGLAGALARSGKRLRQPDFDAGNHDFDLRYDQYPYMETDLPHIKLELGGHICTSMMLVVEA
jgi:hypothetical protein